ncbi:elongation factor P [Patescibacteria group bacterium]|nr:elongation factor P [Patescibacteria group bacterium]
MLSYTDLKKGVKIILEGEPYEILEARPSKIAQREVILKTKVKNLITGSVFSKNFHQRDTLEEAEVLKFEAKFLYSHRDRYFFSEKNNPSKRFDLGLEQIGDSSKFLKPGQIVQGLIFKEKIINISLPIKIQLKVTQAPPGIKGERAQAGTKQITLETGAKINVPIFIEEEDIIEINTETGEYVRRLQPAHHPPIQQSRMGPIEKE